MIIASSVCDNKLIAHWGSCQHTQNSLEFKFEVYRLEGYSGGHERLYASVKPRMRAALRSTAAWVEAAEPALGVNGALLAA